MDTSLRDRCKVNTNVDTDTFVGIKATKDDISVSFPLGFRLDEDDRQLRKDILLLISVLSRNTDKRISEIDKASNTAEPALPIYAYLYVISDYYSRGYYRETEAVDKIAKRGKINWGRTVKTQKAFVDNDEIYYLDFVIKKQNINENELITLIHEYCVNISFECLGWLFTSFKPEKPKLKWNRKLFTNVVKKKLGETFNDRNRQLFKNLLAIIENIGDNETPKDYQYGTNDFEYIWESMIDKAYGVQNKSDYYPLTRWQLDDGEHKNRYLRPDAIMLSRGSVYVLDAKYYKYGISGDAGDLPDSGDINKQITYGEYIAEAETFRNDHGNNPPVYNAFIMPYDSFGEEFHTEELTHYIGSAVSDWKSSDGTKPYEKVMGILVDVKSLMKDYAHDDKKIIELADLIERKANM